MKEYAKDYCKKEGNITSEQILLDVYLLLKENYVATLHNNGEYVTIEFLNGQVFKLKAFDGSTKILPTQI